jgi:hypothetical protein
MKTLEPLGRGNLWNALQDAVSAASKGEDVQFAFNGAIHTVLAFESWDAAKARVEAKTEWPLLSPEEQSEKASAALEKTKREQEAAIASAGVMTEQQMREATIPWPKTIEELSAYITSLTDRPHDYGTSVYAMSMAATAAFNHVASVLGTTGFQASCADMDILRRTRGLKLGFRIVNYEDILYPQEWDAAREPLFVAALNKNADSLRNEARKLLDAKEHAHPNVIAHWRRISEWPQAEHVSA